MIKPHSVQNEYTLVYSGDPSLVLPSDSKERDKALEVARETNVWGPLIIEGQQPTLFHVRPLPGTAVDWLFGEMRRRSLIDPEAFALAFRLALRKVENCGDLKVKFVQIDAQQLVNQDFVDEMYAIDRAIVTEIGGYVLARAMEGISPKR